MKAITAVSINGVIGDGKTLLWDCPEDLKWFKKTTVNNTVVMGRKTFENMPILKNRQTVVLTRNPDIYFEKYLSGFKNRKSQIKKLFDNNVSFASKLPSSHLGEIFICGGSEIYKRYLSECNLIYVSRIPVTINDDEYDNLKYFPEIDRYTFDHFKKKIFDTFTLDIYKKKL